MRRFQTFVVASLLVVAALSLSGCAKWFENPAKPANDAITLANSHLRQAAAIESRVQTAAAGLDALPYTVGGATQGLSITASLTADLASEKVELEAAKSAIDGILKLDVSAPFKQYAKLEATALATRITMLDTNARLYQAMDQMYKGLKSKSVVDPQQILAVIDQIKQELASLNDQEVQQTKAAADYFTSQKLGG
jgi:hypothetical protein